MDRSDGDAWKRETDNRPTEPYSRRLTAYNEAGRAVAAVMRGGTFFSITIEPDGDRDGFTSVKVPRRDMAFVVFAGPWAEARAEWNKPLDGEDDDGCRFDDYVADAFERNADGDLGGYLRRALADAAVYGDVTRYLTFSSEKAWSGSWKPSGRSSGKTPSC